MVLNSNDANNDKANLMLDILFRFATQYIVFHELGHIFNGHVNYMLNHSTIPNIERQAIEMDADCFSSTRCIGMLTDENIMDINSNVCDGVINNRSHAFLLHFISTLVVFALQGMGLKTRPIIEASDLKDEKYLPPRTRYDYFARASIQAYKFMYSDEKLFLGEDINIPFLREVSPNVEQWVNLYYGKTITTDPTMFDRQNNKHEMDKAYIDHCDYLDKFWSQTMRNKLLPYSYFHLAF